MKNNSKLLIMVLSLVLCLSVSIGFALAYFTDYEAARGGAVLNLSGQTWLKEDANEKQKVVSIKNVDEPDMVVRVMVIGDKSHLGTITSDGWTGPDEDGWYYYNKILKGSKDGNGDETSTITAAVNVNGDEDINAFDIVVVHEAERVVYGDDGKSVKVPDGWNIDSISAN